jgi:hypothetical protein
VPVTASYAITENHRVGEFRPCRLVGQRWVALAHGIHDLDIGQPVQIYLDPNRFFVFDSSGALAAAPGMNRARVGEKMGGILLDNVRMLTARRRGGLPDYALKPLNHAWENGGAYALLGPVRLRQDDIAYNIISGLITPKQGRILFDGKGCHSNCRRRSALSRRCSSFRSSTTP